MNFYINNGYACESNYDSIIQNLHYCAGYASLVWKFLRSNHTDEPPAAWMTFLTDHSKEKTPEEVPSDAHRNTSTVWYKWRLDINNNVPDEFETFCNNCAVAMQKLGYLPLRTRVELMNLTIPSITDLDCNYLNCWSFKYL